MRVWRSENEPNWIMRIGSFFSTFFFPQDPKERLGCRPNSNFNDIVTHAFFKAIDWEALENRQIPPPYRPDIHDDRDLTHFDPAFTNEPVQLTPDDPWAFFPSFFSLQQPCKAVRLFGRVTKGCCVLLLRHLPLGANHLTAIKARERGREKMAWTVKWTPCSVVYAPPDPDLTWAFITDFSAVWSQLRLRVPSPWRLLEERLKITDCHMRSLRPERADDHSLCKSMAIWVFFILRSWSLPIESCALPIEFSASENQLFAKAERKSFFFAVFLSFFAATGSWRFESHMARLFLHEKHASQRQKQARACSWRRSWRAADLSWRQLFAWKLRKIAG